MRVRSLFWAHSAKDWRAKAAKSIRISKTPHARREVVLDADGRGLPCYVGTAVLLQAHFFAAILEAFFCGGHEGVDLK